MKVSCFYKSKPYEVDGVDACFGIYCHNKAVKFHHDGKNKIELFKKDGYAIFTSETARGFSFTMKGLDPAKSCVIAIAGKFVPSPEFLGEKYADVTVVHIDDHPSCIIKVEDGSFVIEDIPKSKPKSSAPKKSKGKKNDSVNVSKQDKPKKANKSS